MASSIKVRLDGTIASVELRDSDGYPRLTASLLDQLGNHLNLLLANPACGGVVMHGSERCFAVGADINEVGALSSVSALIFAGEGQGLFKKIAGAPRPVVAAIAGYCLGGGFDLALSCSIRLATPDAVFAHPGATLGLLTGWGGTQRLPRLIGRSHALELLLRGETVQAERALALGLVDAVVDPAELIRVAIDRTRQLAAVPNMRLSIRDP